MYFSKAWLDEHLATIPDKKEKVRQMIIFTSAAHDYLVDDCQKITEEARRLAVEIDYEPGRIAADFYLNSLLIYTGRSKDALLEVRQMETKISSRIDDELIGLVFQMCAIMHWGLGERDKAFEYLYQVLKNETERPSLLFNWTRYMLGVFHFDLKDYDTSLSYFAGSEKHAREQNDEYGIARTLAGIGGVHIALGNYTEAIGFVNEALDGFIQVGHQTAQSRSLNDLGVIHHKLGNLKEAETYLREALELRKNVRYIPGIITTQLKLAELLVDAKPGEAEQMLLSSLDLSEKLHSKQKVAQCHRLLADFYKKSGDPWQAVSHMEKFLEVKALVDGEEVSNKLSRLQQKFAAEKSEQEAEIHRLKNVELKEAYDEIEEKNRNILDSIHYARRIQRALLASEALLERHLDEHFIFYQPKDIVSGDFYWGLHHNDHFFFAVADSTGHGVPGAFMSLLNSSFLGEAVAEKNIAEPAAILGEVRRQLINALNQEGSLEETPDGMDVILAAFDRKTNTLRFACANNPLILVRKGEMLVIGPDKFPVGVYPGHENKPFTPHTLQLQSGDVIYLVTDGFSDQFGGPLGKKFKFRQLRQLLLSISHESAARQKEILAQQFADWKGNLEQVDDILLTGIKIK